MQVGDGAIIHFGINPVPVKLLEVEAYRKAFIVRCELVWNPGSGDRVFLCFPNVEGLPGVGYFTQDLYEDVPWVEWKDHLWPCPMKEDDTRGSSGVQIVKLRRRVDLILNAYHLARQNFGGDIGITINPQDEYEREQVGKLELYRGGDKGV